MMPERKTKTDPNAVVRRSDRRLMSKGGVSPGMMKEAKKISKMLDNMRKQMEGIGSSAKASGASAGKKPKNVRMKDMMARGLKKK